MRVVFFLPVTSSARIVGHFIAFVIAYASHSFVFNLLLSSCLSSFMSLVLIYFFSWPDLLLLQCNCLQPKGVRLVVSKYQWGSRWRMLLPGVLFACSWMPLPCLHLFASFYEFSLLSSFISFLPQISARFNDLLYIMLISPCLCAFLGLVQLPWSRIRSRSRDSIRSGCRGGCFTRCLPRYRDFRRRLDSWGKLT